MMSEIMKNNTHIFVFFKNDVKSWSVIRDRITNTLISKYPSLDEKKAKLKATELYKTVYTEPYGKIIVTSNELYSS